MNNVIKESFSKLGLSIEDDKSSDLIKDTVKSNVDIITKSHDIILLGIKHTIKVEDIIFKSRELDELYTEDDLVKGISSEVMNSERFIVDKDGSDIIEAVDDMLDEVEDEADDCEEELDDLKKKIGIDPVGEEESYYFDGYEHIIEDIPPTYTWDQMNGFKAPVELTETVTVSGGAEIKSPDKKTPTVRDLMQEYNGKRRKFIAYKVEIINLNTIVANLDEKKKYKLTLRQLALLGL